MTLTLKPLQGSGMRSVHAATQYRQAAIEVLLPLLTEQLERAEAEDILSRAVGLHQQASWWLLRQPGVGRGDAEHWKLALQSDLIAALIVAGLPVPLWLRNG